LPPQATIGLLYLGLLLVFVKLFEDFFGRAKIPSIVGAVIGGVLLGRSALNLVDPTTVSLFVNLGVIMMLFLAGADEFDLESTLDIIRAKRRFFLLSLANWAAATACTLYVLIKYGGMPPVLGLFAASVFGMSSVAPLVRVLKDMNITKSQAAVSVFTYTLTVEIIGLVLSAVLLQVALRNAVTASVILFSAAPIAVFLVGLFALRRQFPKVIVGVEKFVGSREAVLALMLALVFIVGYFGELVGFNAAIAALFLGYMFSRYLERAPQILERLRGLTYGFFEPIFFGGLGLSVNLKLVAVNPALLTGLVLAILGAKLAVGLITATATGSEPRLSLAFGSVFKGGVDGALLLSALTLGVISGGVYSAGIVAILILVVVGPVGLKRVLSRVETFSEEGVYLTHSFIRTYAEGVPASKVATTFPEIVVYEHEKLKIAIEKMSKLNVFGAVVVNSERRAVGTLFLNDLIELGEKDYQSLEVGSVMRDTFVQVAQDTPASELIEIFHNSGVPVVAVVDDEGRTIATVTERELYLFLTSSGQGARKYDLQA